MNSKRVVRASTRMGNVCRASSSPARVAKKLSIMAVS
jgi:hypothetical protein